MNAQELIQKGWADHADDAEGVADRLQDGIALAETTADMAAMAALIVHVYGEHLGRWAGGLGLLQQLVDSPAFSAEEGTGKAVYRSMAVLELCGGNLDRVAELEQLGRSEGGAPADSDRARIRAIAASALAGQKRTPEATAAFQEALSLASYGPTAEDPAARALAITGNNLACELEEKADRTPEEVELMKLAARTGRKFWEVAGTWQNVAWAEFRMAKSLLQAAEPAAAVDHARECLELFAANDGAAFARFFAHEALAQALHAAGQPGAAEARDAAAALLDDVDAENVEYCRAELAKLDERLASGA